MEYIGIDDGCGGYGDELADLYECHDCGMTIEVTASEYPFEESDDSHDVIADRDATEP